MRQGNERAWFCNPEIFPLVGHCSEISYRPDHTLPVKVADYALSHLGSIYDAARTIPLIGRTTLRGFFILFSLVKRAPCPQNIPAFFQPKVVTLIAKTPDTTQVEQSYPMDSWWICSCWNHSIEPSHGTTSSSCTRKAAGIVKTKPSRSAHIHLTMNGNPPPFIELKEDDMDKHHHRFQPLKNFRPLDGTAKRLSPV